MCVCMCGCVCMCVRVCECVSMCGCVCVHAWLCVYVRVHVCVSMWDVLDGGLLVGWISWKFGMGMGFRQEDATDAAVANLGFETSSFMVET